MATGRDPGQPDPAASEYFLERSRIDTLIEVK
jgi:hypothetical protein